MVAQKLGAQNRLVDTGQAEGTYLKVGSLGSGPQRIKKARFVRYSKDTTITYHRTDNPAHS